ncbi:bifunctional diguanylate cyclase/phosphodiesterase [uncultured Sphingomonas sp.]|uniref:putative bifunctional diguanylate cyclase/phosphodiesterase n=1 Tax=uncultured Sphingomonas sp. TaxID=158754 RepID=UPI0026026155|nr:GGDEF domain-containing protein [uncultured Sphingomonas sp.]
MLHLQNIILEMIATGEPLDTTMARLCLEVEKMTPGAVCSVLLVDGEGRIHPLAGPSLPATYSAALDGIAIGADVGSCGTAAYTRQPVVVTDIADDHRWIRYRHMVLPLGYRACWSSPILDTHGQAIGTFAFYYRERRGPTALEEAIVRHCLHLGTIAIERHQRVEDRERRASTDALTGLGNRAAFNAALGALDCTIPGAWALLLVDLDNLKVVNDTLGHGAGDCLLTCAAKRVADAVRGERVFRVGGDEFAVLLSTPVMLRDLEESARHILAALAHPADCGGQIVVPRATIGAAVVAHGDRTTQRVRQNADFALYHAKETGRGGFVRYWPGLGSRMTSRLDAIRDVDAALRDDRIEAFYQPIVRLDTREVVGLEALCRMRIGDNIVSASAFYEATIDVHIAAALTERMIALVAADLRDWLAMGIPFQHVGINVSSADIHGGALNTILATAFEREGVSLRHVILEVTESVYMDNDGGIVARELARLRGLGLRIALDDFGTGYASLTHLLSVPVDVIKIDRSFVERLETHAPSIAIVEALIDIARKLDIRLVAEGIETEAQARALQSMGAVLGQGYLFARPASRDATTALLQARAQGAVGSTQAMIVKLSK